MLVASRIHCRCCRSAQERHAGRMASPCYLEQMTSQGWMRGDHRGASHQAEPPSATPAGWTGGWLAGQDTQPLIDLSARDIPPGRRKVTISPDPGSGPTLSCRPRPSGRQPRRDGCVYCARPRHVRNRTRSGLDRRAVAHRAAAGSCGAWLTHGPSRDATRHASCVRRGGSATLVAASQAVEIPGGRRACR